jgi:hypothetical protein
VLIGWPEDQFIEQVGFYWGQGLRLHRVNRYSKFGVGAPFLSDAIFKPGSDGRRVLWDATLDAVKAEDAVQRTHGYRLIQASGVEQDLGSNQVRYVAIWVPGTDARPVLYHASWDQLMQANGNHWAAGYRMKYLNIFRHGPNYWYDAIWEPGGDGRPVVTGWDWNSFVAKRGELWAAGYRLTVSQAYLSPS